MTTWIEKAAEEICQVVGERIDEEGVKEIIQRCFDDDVLSYPQDLLGNGFKG